MKIGILAVQGDFELHGKMLTNLGVEYTLVRLPRDLASCQGLIIPGGESTTFVKLLKKSGLFEELRKFGRQKTIMGTCAGLIILARKIRNYPLETLGLINIEVERNAYGRQIDSFVDNVEINLNGTIKNFEAVFIRAPKIVRLGEGVTALGKHKSDIVLAENKHILVATFHPELTDDTRIHEYFLKKVASNAP